MHSGGATAEAVHHCPPSWVRQSRKSCTQPIHNHMVVDLCSMSIAILTIPVSVPYVLSGWQSRWKSGLSIMKPRACGMGYCLAPIYLWIHGHHYDAREQGDFTKMKMFIAALASSMFALGPVAQAAQKPTIVLVHGAFE